MKITATFRGKNNSLGFVYGQEYTLEITTTPFSRKTVIKSTCGLMCPYASAKSFIENWDKITHIQ